MSRTRAAGLGLVAAVIALVAGCGRQPIGHTTVQVLETYAGKAPGATLVVRQSGSESLVVAGLGDLLVPGEEYILYLTPFTFDPKVPGTGEWIPTGEVGVYHLARGKFERTAEAAPRLPATVSAADPLAS